MKAEYQYRLCGQVYLNEMMDGLFVLQEHLLKLNLMSICRL